MKIHICDQKTALRCRLRVSPLPRLQEKTIHGHGPPGIHIKVLQNKKELPTLKDTVNLL